VLGQPVDELLRRMSSREFTEWVAYFTWKGHVEAIHRDHMQKKIPVSDACVHDLAWRAMGVVVDDADGGQFPDDE
jgi:hypothetical protein